MVRFFTAVLVALTGFMLAACNDITDDENKKLNDENKTPNVIIYPFPSGMPKFANVTLKADGELMDLYSVKVNNTYIDYSDAQNIRDSIPVAMFDMKGPVEIEITLPSNPSPSTVVVRPLSSEITPVISGNQITFTINQPNQYSVEYNNSADNPKNAVLIFANQQETFTGTTVVEPGIHVQNYTVNSGQTLYLKPGAVVRGKVVMNSGSKVVGRGIIDGSHLNNWKDLEFVATLPIETYGGNNLEINGISIFDSNAWNIQIQNASNVKISNVKIVSSRYNSDGISIQSSNNVTIDNCFIRTWDDGIVVKNYSGSSANNSHTITAANTRLWTDLAQSLEIGFETNKGKSSNPRIYDVKFENIEIFHALHKAPISIHNGDNANINNITFKNIIVENYQAGNAKSNGWNYLIDIANLTSAGMGGDPNWTAVASRGNISNVLIENVKIISGKTDPGYRFTSIEGGSLSVTLKDIYNRDTKMVFTTSCPNTTLTGSTLSVGGDPVAAQWAGPWGTFNDSAESGTSTINVSAAAGVYTITGNVTHDTTWGGGYAGWTSAPDAVTLTALRAATAISFKVTGDGKSYRMLLPTSDITDYCYYSHSFSTTNGAETTVTVYLSNFAQPSWGVQKPLSKSLIQTIQWQTSDGALGSFSLKIKDVMLY